MADPTVDVDSDTARELARDELSKPMYPRQSFTDRSLEWLDDLLNRILNKGAELPGGWLSIVILVLLVLAAVVFATHMYRTTLRTRADGDFQLFGGEQLSAEAHRAAAEACATRGDWAAAIRHRLRAVARALEESGALAVVAGRTATELANAAAAVYPGLSGPLQAAASIFNDVSYGEQPGAPDGYRLIADLDRQLADAPRAPTPAGAASGWTTIR
ncbi:DUF4129 domain-containing protein [Mycolicibacterium brumae]|nr:DUF4129 domain-containing protein [Mycolicibacterium brumae]RWA22254.1 hypothetical protein MBRU_13255 [Mycolicibacterium brumae DSM 44177]UWW07243.1 DUF4129 domain-containing protein [Mycolicibacterium brumae]